MIDHLKMILQAAISEKVFPGCAAGICYENRLQIITLGHQTYDNDSPEITQQTVYDVASITKVVPASLLALKLINDSEMSLSDQLIKFVPEYQGSYRQKILIEHLLTHTLSFDFRLSEYKDFNSDEIIEKILTAKLHAEPGERYFYANATSILLGMTVERYTGMTLDRVAEEKIFNPLGMETTTFYPSPNMFQQIAPSEIDPWRGREIKGEVHDESAWAIRPKLVGSAGLFSTVPDLLKIIEMLLNEGVYNGKEIFKSEMVNLMHTNRLKSQTEWTGLGWELNQESFMGTHHSGSAFGKTGFTGCSMVIDPEKKVGFVLLSNHIYPHRCKNRDRINSVRRMFADIILEKL